MNYLAIQVTSGLESKVASLLRYALSNLWDLNRYEFLRGIQVLHFSKGIAKYEGEKVRVRTKSILPGYLYIGFLKWDNHLYYLLKSVPGVLKVFVDKRELARTSDTSKIPFTTQSEMDQMLANSEFDCQIQIVVPDTDEAMEAMCELQEKVKSVTEQPVLRNGLMKRLLSISVPDLRSIANKTVGEIALSILNVLKMPDRFSPTDFLKREKVNSLLHAEFLLKWIVMKA